MAALIWVILGIVLIAAEVLSGELVLIALGVAALAGAATEAAFGLTLVSAGVFAAVAIGLVTVARPTLKRRLQTARTTDNAAALVGERATVLTPVDAAGGLVLLRGTEWTARSFDETQVIEPGTSVAVMQIAGATAVVLADGL
ncbi:NfeD family protein [Actinokineospora pegani]|uniref:NfeD family protein n=1 Tax=Actinokineospora pegani TaxID=2654637 RepID=UPI0012EB0178|nr:NfeD family protein [Actinokineospora pegani]